MAAFRYRLQRKLTLETRRLTALLRQAPTFMIIGAQKGGTTSLYQYLDTHPQCAGAWGKEVKYFDENYDRDRWWYRGHFAFRQPAIAHTFDASPSYLFMPNVPQRIAQHSPDAKFIALLRHPIARAISHYQMNLRLPHIPEERSFAQAIHAEADLMAAERAKMQDDSQYFSQPFKWYSYLARGHYAQQLQRWYEHFSAAQILVIQSERLFTQPAMVYAEVLDFLNLDTWTPPAFKSLNQASYDFDIDAETRIWLEEHFAPHNHALYDLLGTTYDW